VGRVYQGESILGRSYCPQCRTKIAWYDNIPLLSYLLLRGRCRHCHKTISIQYPLVEFAAGILFLLVFLHIFHLSIFFYPGFLDFTSEQIFILFRDWFFVSVLLAIFLFDWQWMVIPDIITLPAILIFLVINIFAIVVLRIDNIIWQNLFFSGIIGGGFFLAQYIVSKGKWIGGGDVRLGFLMGIVLGWPDILTALFLAYILGTLISLPLLLAKKKQLNSQVPFGIFLAIAAVITLFWGKDILHWYFTFYL
jgi:prepilin signal peptidase PulO-like enzyme (type II secretory pathway)